MNHQQHKKFRKIKDRLIDLYKRQGLDIKEGKFIYLSANILEEMKWLCEELDKKMGQDAEKLDTFVPVNKPEEEEVEDLDAVLT